MESSPNSSSLWPSDEGQTEPSTLVEAHASAKAVTPIEALAIPLEFEGLNLGEFPLGDIWFKLFDAIMDKLWHEFQIPLKFDLEVLLPMDLVSIPPLGHITLY